MRRCDCGIALEHDGDRCDLCGPPIPSATILLVAGHLLGIGVATVDAFETAERVALDLDARGLLAAPVCQYCGKGSGTHQACAEYDRRLSELDALADERESA